MTDFTRLDDAILTTLRAGVTQLRSAEPTLALVACGLVEDLTGFFIAGADTQWLAELDDSGEIAWLPSEWPLSAEDPTDTPPGRVTSAIWELVESLPRDDGDDDYPPAYEALRVDYVDRIVRALQIMRGAGELRRVDGGELWVWLHAADAYDEDLDDVTFARLHDAETAAVFATRFDGGHDALLRRLIDRPSSSEHPTG